MPGIAPAIDYTARTFEVIRERGLTLLANRITSYRYSSFVATDVIPAVIDVLAWFHEQNSHYYDRSRLNSLLMLADEPESMSVLTLAQGYRMRPATSASVAIQALPSPAQPVPITLRKGTRVSVGDLVFEVGEDAIIPAGEVLWPDGSTADLIVLVEGTTKVDTFVATGEVFQPCELSQPGCIEGSVVATILGETWQEVQSLAFTEGTRRGRDTFTGSGLDGQEYLLELLHVMIGLDDEDGVRMLLRPPGGRSEDVQVWHQVASFTGAPREFVMLQTAEGVTTIKFGLAANGAAPPLNSTVDVLYLVIGAQKRYQLTYDPDFRGTLRFGNGTLGVIPTAGATISVSYRVGGGVRGNVPRGAINTTIAGYLPNGARTSLAIRNLERGSGGNPPETVDHARFFAPRFAKANERAVTKEDWTTLASTYFDKLYGAPSHASAYLKQRTPELNTVRVALWGRDENGRLELAGTPLKVGVKNFLDSKRTMCTVTEIVDGTIVFLDMDISIVLETGRVRQAVFADVTTAINRYMQSANVRPGVDVSISKLYAAIQKVPGVEQATITKVTGGTRTTLDLGTGDGTTTLFSGNLAVKEGTSVVPKSLTVSTSDGLLQVVDNGEGSFVGSNDTAITPGTVGNVVAYADGTFSIQFATAPVIGTSITAEAHLGVFFPALEDLGASDGTVTALDGATDYYPVVKRAPRGVWAGDPHKVVDGFRIGTTAQFRGTLPTGIIASSLTFTDSTGTPQVITSNGAGVLLDGLTVVGSYSTVTGAFAFTFQAAPTLPVRATWTTRTVDIFLPDDLLPIVPGRLFLWGGYGADGLQTPAELLAYDDGEGNIAGDVVVGGTIDYETGHVVFAWNTAPPPGPAAGALCYGALTQVPDGTLRTFDFKVSVNPPGGTAPFANLSRTGLDGEGRTRFQFSDLSAVGTTFEDAWDNWNTDIHGPSIDREGTNFIQYAIGTGKVTFKVAPPLGAPQLFAVQITNVTTLMYAGFVWRVKTPGGPGLDKGLFADHTGKFWGPPAAGNSNAFPVDRLDHLRGRYLAALAGSAVQAGRNMQLTYDALMGVPPSLDIPIAGDQVAAVGRISLVEKPAETFANA
jgi:hypothetical protein